MLVDYHDFENGTVVLVFDVTARGECNSEQFTVKSWETYASVSSIKMHSQRQTIYSCMESLTVF